MQRACISAAVRSNANRSRSSLVYWSMFLASLPVPMAMMAPR